MMDNEEFDERLGYIEESLGIDPKVERFRNKCESLHPSWDVRNVDNNGYKLTAEIEVGRACPKRYLTELDSVCDSYTVLLDKKEIRAIRRIATES